MNTSDRILVDREELEILLQIERNDRGYGLRMNWPLFDRLTEIREARCNEEGKPWYY